MESESCLCSLRADVMAGQALVQALQDKAWPELEVLVLDHNPAILSDEVTASFLKLLSQDGLGDDDKLPRLRELHLVDCGLSEEGDERLFDSIARGACPRLNSISLERKVKLEEGGWQERLCVIDPPKPRLPCFVMRRKR